MNDFIALTKDVALVSVAALYYLIFTLPLIWLLDRIIAATSAAPRRDRRP